MRKNSKLTVKKLQLNRETLRTLQEMQLTPAMGASLANTGCQGSTCIGSVGGWPACDTHDTCTTGFC